MAGKTYSEYRKDQHALVVAIAIFKAQKNRASLGFFKLVYRYWPLTKTDTFSIPASFAWSITATTTPCSVSA